MVVLSISIFDTSIDARQQSTNFEGKVFIKHNQSEVITGGINLLSCIINRNLREEYCDKNSEVNQRKVTEKLLSVEK